VRIVTAQEMQKIDRYAIQKIGIPGVVLMENAGRAAFCEIQKREKSLTGKRIGVVCGTGNNGGDGFVIARLLCFAKANVDVWVVGKSLPKKEEALTNLKIIQNMGINPTFIRYEKDLRDPSKKILEWEFVIDALFGTGLARPLSGLYFKCVEMINHSKKKIYSMDIPSGLNADTGTVMEKAVKADLTITFGFQKRGFYLNEGPLLCGEVVTSDISLSEPWADEVKASRLFSTERDEIEKWFRPREAASHKGTYGHVLVLAGSPQKSGASVLTSRAALRAGAGLVTLATPQSAHAIVKSQLTEVMSELLPDDGNGKLKKEAWSKLYELCQGKQALVVGPGLISHPGLRGLLEILFKRIEIPIILDADGLNVFGKELTKIGKSLHKMILTPHPGEMARLVGKTTKQVQENRISIAQEFSLKTGAVVVLKGAYSVIALPNRDTYLNPTGNPGMASAGMGDVLSGIIGAYVAQGLSLERAAIAGAFYHGLAGDHAVYKKGPRGLLASDLIDELPHLSL